MDSVAETLADYLMESVAECLEYEDAEPADVVMALMLVTERALRMVRKHQTTTEQIEQAKWLQQKLAEMVIEFGRVPS